MRESGAELGENDIHLSSPLENFKHHQTLARQQDKLESVLVKLESTWAQSMEEFSKTQTNVKHLESETKDVLSNKILNLQSQLDDIRKRLGKRGADTHAVDNNVAIRLKVLEDQEAKNQQMIKNQKKEISDLRAELQAFRREYQMQQRSSHVGHAPRHSSVPGRDNQSMPSCSCLLFLGLDGVCLLS